MERTGYYNRFGETIRILGDLARYKLSLAIAFSSATGYFLFHSNIDRNFFFMIAGVFLLASGSTALNQYTESEQDAKMSRTKGRPLPASKISSGLVIIFFSFLLINGSCLLLLAGVIPSILGVICVILYNFLYTPLKRISILVILPGALVGAIPPVIGWVSAGGTIFSNKILLFSAFMFLWQYPHFWLLIIQYGKEYEAAGFQTIGKFLNAKQIRYLVFFWTLLSLVYIFLYTTFIIDITSNLPWLLVILNLIFILIFFRLLFLQKDSRDIRSAFLLYNFYGFLIMLALITDSFLI